MRKPLSPSQQSLPSERRRDAALVVMARHPTPGRVKTRLARDIGADAACALHRAFLADIGMRFGSHSEVDLVWAYEPARADFGTVVGAHSRCFAQEGRDLGDRMHNAFRHLFVRGYRRVAMIGADVPHLRDDDLDTALQRLEDCDVVLGPSDDGGYYLVAMRAAHDIFQAVPMGTDQVLAATLARIEALKLSVHSLPPTFDIDEIDDLRRLRSLLGERAWQQRLPHTMQALDALVIASFE